MKPRDRAFRFLIRQSKSALRRLAGAPIVVEGQTLDLQTQVMLDAIRRLKIAEATEVDEARRRMDEDGGAVGPDVPAMATERDVLVPGPAGPMRARVYGPKSARGKPGMLVYFHGGGFVAGSIASHDAPLRVLADESGVVIASIDYRLGPEHMFPAAVEDALTAYAWARAHAGDFGADRARVGVGGDSAGGNLSAVVCHLAKRERMPQPTHQLLIYPAIDWSRACASHRTFAEGYYLEESRTFWYEERYLNRIEERDDPRASPIRFDDFSGLAPATIVSAGFDVLRDEVELYARALERGGTPVDFCCETSLIHGFFNMSGAIDAARAANTRLASHLRAALG